MEAWATEERNNEKLIARITKNSNFWSPYLPTKTPYNSKNYKNEKTEHLKKRPPYTLQNKAYSKEEKWLSAIFRLQPQDEFRINLKKAYIGDPIITQNHRNLSWDNGIGLWMWKNRIYIPKALQEQVIYEEHAYPGHGHQGITKTCERIQRKYDFPNLLQQIKKVILKCNICQRGKSARHRPYGLLQPLEIPKGPWQSVTMDLIVKLPAATLPGGNTKYDSIHVAVDRLTKYAVFTPWKETWNAEISAERLRDALIIKHGLPFEIITDRGSVFTSKYWNTFMKTLGIKQRFSTAYHPQTDGQTERLNQILTTYLRMHINDSQNDWPRWLGMAEFAYNSAKHEATEKTPFEANYGYNPVIKNPLLLIENPVDLALITAEKSQKITKDLQENLRFAQERMIKYANKKRSNGPTFKKGDKVYIANKNFKSKRPSKKLDHKKLGPFLILSVVSDVDVRLKLPPAMKKIFPIFHISLLEPAAPGIPINTTDEAENEETDEEIEYEVEKILGIKGAGKTLRYLVRWKGYSPENDSWEPIKHLKHAQQAIQDFQQFMAINNTKSLRKSPRKAK